MLASKTKHNLTRLLIFYGLIFLYGMAPISFSSKVLSVVLYLWSPWGSCSWVWSLEFGPGSIFPQRSTQHSTLTFWVVLGVGSKCVGGLREGALCHKLVLSFYPSPFILWLEIFGSSWQIAVVCHNHILSPTKILHGDQKHLIVVSLCPLHGQVFIEPELKLLGKLRSLGNSF